MKTFRLTIIGLLMLFFAAGTLAQEGDPLYDGFDSEYYEYVQESPRQSNTNQRGVRNPNPTNSNGEMCPQSSYPDQRLRPGQFGTPQDFIRRYGGLSPETILKIKQRDPRSPLYNYGARSYMNGSSTEKRQKAATILSQIFGG